MRLPARGLVVRAAVVGVMVRVGAGFAAGVGSSGHAGPLPGALLWAARGARRWWGNPEFPLQLESLLPSGLVPTGDDGSQELRPWSRSRAAVVLPAHPQQQCSQTPSGGRALHRAHVHECFLGVCPLGAEASR